MNHLDEGTIHAWLDGALDAAQARDVEGHVAQCATCSAAVAEARGLIAGSSRILNALDDVPAGVMPKRVPTAPAPRRQWRAAPWVTGIAALFLGAVVLRTVDVQKSATESRALLKNERVLFDTATVAPPFAVPAAPQADQVVSAPKAQAGARARKSAPREARQSVASVGGAAGADASQSAASVGQIAGKNAPIAPMPAAAGAAAAAAAANLREVAPERIAAAPSTVAKAIQLRSGGVALEKEMVVPAGCYRLDNAAPARTAVSSIAAEVTQRARRAAPTAAAAPREDFMAAPSLPALIQLDTMAGPVGLIVRTPASDSIIGSWRRIGDSLRVDLLARGMFTLATVDRVVCPER